MTRRTLNRIARRLTLGLVLAAVVVPATAQAMPIGKVSGAHRNTPVIVDPKHGHGPHTSFGNVAAGFVPADPGQFRMAAVRPLRTVIIPTPASSGLDWTDALIGAGVTAGLAALAMGGAVAVRRQRQFGYR
jgi:MYXO-CTERM domain-containing protein